MLFKKMLRDMSKNKTQFISIFLMAFLGVYIYTGVGSEWVGLRRSAEKFYEQTNLADVFLYSNGFSDETVQKVLTVDGITSIERRIDLTAFAILDGNPQINLHFIEKNDISAMYLVDGENFKRDDTDGIWIDKRFADARGFTIGDSITIVYNGYELNKIIRGLIYSGEYVYRTDGEGITPDFYSNGYAYISDAAFPLPDMLIYNTLLLKKTSTATDIYVLEEQISNALDGNYSVFLARSNHTSVNAFNNEILQHKMMSDVFPIVFFLVALLIMTTTMTRIVTSQRTQIGVLKALGFNKNTIIRHYMSYGFWLVFSGVVLGIVLGPMTLPYLFYPSMSGFYTLPEWKPYYDVSFFIASAFMISACTLTVYFVSRRLLGDTPAATLRPKSPKPVKHNFFENTTLWNKLGFNMQWNIRDTARNKIRSIMAVIGVFGCTMLLVCAFGMEDGSNDLRIWQYERLFQFETKLNISETASIDEIDSIADKVNGELLMEGMVEIKANGIKKTGTLTVPADDTTLLKFTDTAFNYVEMPSDGLMLASKMANALGVSIGDTIEWHIYGEEDWTLSEIAFINRAPTMQGITLTKSHFEKLGYNFNPTGILSAQNTAEKYDGISSVMSTSDIVKGWDELVEQVKLLVNILIAAAVILSIVVLYNLGLLSFNEMERELATLKVIGLKSRKLGGLLLTQNIWFSSIGFALGPPAGMWLVKQICDSSGESFDFPVNLHLTNLLLSFCITFGLSIFVNRLFSRKIKRLNMVEALKSIE